MTVYHILSSDIPHHNHRVLEFFQHTFGSQYDLHFFVASTKPLENDFPALNIRRFATQKNLARTVIAKKQQEPTACFFFHGQFNLWIWLAILTDRLPAQRCYWHIWGADLYQEKKGISAQIFYFFRRQAQKKLNAIFATRGDLRVMKQRLKRENPKDELIYFPTKLAENCIENSRSDAIFTILVGNSGDPSNQHIHALKRLKTELNITEETAVKLIIPMGYPAQNEAYIQQVQAVAYQLFSANQVEILQHKLPFDEYRKQIQQADLAVFNFERQQGIGTICLCLQHCTPVLLNPKNPFIEDLQQENIAYLTFDNLTQEKVKNVADSLQMLDLEQISFFPNGYNAMWRNLLERLA